MKFVKLFEQWLLETERGVSIGRDLGILDASEVTKGRDIFPIGELSVKNFGDIPETVDDLVVGQEYLLWEPGMDSWQGFLKYTGQKNSMHIFVSTLQFDDQSMEFNTPDLKEYIKDGDIVEQID